jgi:hypothetical protein
MKFGRHWTCRLTSPQRSFVHRRSVRIIETAFRMYCKVRYRELVENWDDRDVITMEPVSQIPRTLLFLLQTNGRKYGFHAAQLLQWLNKNPVHPVTREEVTVDVREKCKNVVSKHSQYRKLVRQFENIEEIRKLQREKKALLADMIEKHEKPLLKYIDAIRNHSVIQTLYINQNSSSQILLRYEYCVHSMPMLPLQKLSSLLSKLNNHIAHRYDVLDILDEEDPGDMPTNLHTFCEIVD